MENLIVIGAGGHARFVVSLISGMNRFNIVGVADREPPKSPHESILGHPVKFSFSDLKSLFSKGTKHAAIALGDNKERFEIFNECKKIGFSIPNLIHASAVLEPSVKIGEGNHLGLGVLIGAEVSIGDNNVFYSGTILEHETIVGSHCFFSPGVKIAGRVKVSDSCYLGIGSVVREKITLQTGCTLGAGAVVLNEVAAGSRVAGVPAKILASGAHHG